MKYALCNEMFEPLSLVESCRLAVQYGFSGMELAPFTLSDSPQLMRKEARCSVRNILTDYGLEFVGFHWLLNTPAGLHLTTPDTTNRNRSWAFMKYLVEFCAEMGGGVMVLGSGPKRNADGIAVETALRYLKEGLRDLAPFAKQGSTTILIEPLSTKSTNVINTLEAAEKLIYEIGHPGVSGIFDFHNCAAEKLPWSNLIGRFKSIIKHVHFNEIDGGYPGSGNSDFIPAFQALKKINYSGWISIEVFNQKEPPLSILQQTRTFITHLESQII